MRLNRNLQQTSFLGPPNCPLKGHFPRGTWGIVVSLKVCFKGLDRPRNQATLPLLVCPLKKTGVVPEGFQQGLAVQVAVG